MIIRIEDADTVFILINYNGAKDTAECVNSIEALEETAAVVIVDNASIDEDYFRLEKFTNKSITILRSNTNLGFAAGNNLAIQYTFEFQNIKNIVLLNNDTVIDKRMLKHFKEDKEWGKSILVPKMLYYKQPDKIWYAGGTFDKKTGRAKHYKMNQKDDENGVNSFTCTFASGCCMVIPTDVFRKVGLLKEEYFMYCEDSEFCLRLIMQDYKIKYIGNAVLWHKVGSSSGGEESVFSTYYMCRNRLFYLKEYRSYFYSATIFVFYITRVLRIIQYTLLRKNTMKKAILDALHDAAANKSGKVY